MIALLTGVISQGMFEKNMMKMREEQEDRQIRQKISVTQCERLFFMLTQTAGPRPRGRTWSRTCRSSGTCSRRKAC